jgi:beta-glucanase (GH16 family)
MHSAGRAVTAVLSATFLAGWGRCGGPEPLPDRPTGAWRLVWSDEFEGPAGTRPDAARWTFDVGTGVNGWGNAQLEYDTDRPQNVSLDGSGNLAITARRESFGGREYTSARIKTQGLLARAYGRFEARIRLPAGQGIWPAFWMLGASFPAVGWPACGEIDVMEYRGQEPSRVAATVHGPSYSGGGGIGRAYDLPGGARFDQGFHVFAVEWDPGWLVFSVDGVEFHTVTPLSLPVEDDWVFDAPFFLLLNVAVGGNYVGPPDGSTTFPQTMLVDWVRVYERETP